MEALPDDGCTAAMWRSQHTHALLVATTRRVVGSWRFEPATTVDSVAGRPRTRPTSARARVTVSYRLVPDSTALGGCHAAAPVTRTCATQVEVIRARLHE